MSIEWLTQLAWKSLALCGLTLALLALARNRSAAEKALIGDAGLLALLLLPLSMAFMPRFEVSPPQMLGAAFDKLAAPAAEPATLPADGSAALASAASTDWNAMGLALYLLPAAALVAGLAYSLLRLRRLYRRAQVLEDGRWLTALAAAQNQTGVKHGTALLISDEINSPISWGVVRPIIMINSAARSASERAEAVIAHELAHVHRVDWLRLILARLAAALVWFNPLVWVLARRSHQLREEAADDAVLRMRVAKSDYADLLVTAVRHSNARPLLAANGVAPSRSSIAQRVEHVLDASKPRRPANLGWALATLALALGANAALAASEPVIERSWGMDRNAGERAVAELASLPSEHAQTIARAIQARDWDARRVQGNTTFNEPRAVRPLVRALRDDDPRVRRIALWGLSEMRPTPDPLATPYVSRLLDDPSPEVRAQAARAIGDFESVQTSHSIQKLLRRDPNPLVRMHAAHALGDIQDPGSRTALELALRDPDVRVRAKAAWALTQVAEAEMILSRQ
jgi:beta-lactamase regulating signal transducer with metallopeptidase domain